MGLFFGERKSLAGRSLPLQTIRGAQLVRFVRAPSCDSPGSSFSKDDSLLLEKLSLLLQFGVNRWIVYAAVMRAGFSLTWEYVITVTFQLLQMLMANVKDT